MKITQVATTLNGALQPINKEWEVLTLTGAPPLRSFQQVLYLRFATGDDADGIHIDAQKTTFQTLFKFITYNAKAHPVPALAANITNNGQDTVFVELDAPRQISQVQLRSNLSLGNKATLEFYRLDGDTPADSPTTIAAFANGNLSLVLNNVGLASTISRSAVPQTRAAAITVAQQASARVLPFASNTAIVPEDFTDIRFALRLKNPSAPLANLGVNDITSLSLNSYPAAPRVGLADPNDLDSTIFFARLEGEIGKEPQPTPGNLDAQAEKEFSSALQRYLDNFWAKLVEDAGEGNAPAVPPYVDVALVIASDAPCRVQISNFALEYALVRQSFPSRQEKVVLKFAGSTVETQSAFFHLPENAEVTTATLQVVPSFGDDRLAGAVTGIGLEPASLAQAIGVHVGIDRWAAQPVTPTQATAVSGLALGLMALAGETRLLLALHEDFQGQPSGKQLVEMTLDLESSGERVWKTLFLSDKVILPSQPHWLLLKAVRGAAIWLATSGEPAVRLLEAPKAGNIGRTLSLLNGTQALYRILSTTLPTDPAQKTAPFTLAVGTQSVLATSETEEATLIFDLTSAIQGYAATAVNGELEIPIALTSGLPGIATVYLPQVLYDLGQ